MSIFQEVYASSEVKTEGSLNSPTVLPSENLPAIKIQELLPLTDECQPINVLAV